MRCSRLLRTWKDGMNFLQSILATVYFFIQSIMTTVDFFTQSIMATVCSSLQDASNHPRASRYPSRDRHYQFLAEGDSQSDRDTWAQSVVGWTWLLHLSVSVYGMVNLNDKYILIILFMCMNKNVNSKKSNAKCTIQILSVGIEWIMLAITPISPSLPRRRYDDSIEFLLFRITVFPYTSTNHSVLPCFRWAPWRR